MELAELAVSKHGVPDGMEKAHKYGLCAQGTVSVERYGAGPVMETTFLFLHLAYPATRLDERGAGCYPPPPRKSKEM